MDLMEKMELMETQEPPEKPAQPEVPESPVSAPNTALSMVESSSKMELVVKHPFAKIFWCIGDSDKSFQTHIICR